MALIILISIPETQQTSHSTWPSASIRYTGYLALERVDVRENTALKNQGIKELSLHLLIHAGACTEGRYLQVLL